jgi:hypothetical protein
MESNYAEPVKFDNETKNDVSLANNDTYFKFVFRGLSITIIINPKSTSSEFVKAQHIHDSHCSDANTKEIWSLLSITIKISFFLDKLIERRLNTVLSPVRISYLIFIKYVIPGKDMLQQEDHHYYHH